MKKLFITGLFAAAFLFSGNVFAQKMNIGVNLATGMPMGTFGDAANFGLGGMVSFDYYFNDQFNLGIEAGYLSFGYKEPFDDESLAIIPLHLTGDYHMDLADELEFYAGAGVGVYMATPSFEGAEASTDFGFAPRVGLAYELTDALFLDLTVNYSYILSGGTETTEVGGVTIETETEDMSYLGINLGLLYTIGE